MKMQSADNAYAERVRCYAPTRGRRDPGSMITRLNDSDSARAVVLTSDGYRS